MMAPEVVAMIAEVVAMIAEVVAMAAEVAVTEVDVHRIPLVVSFSIHMCMVIQTKDLPETAFSFVGCCIVVSIFVLLVAYVSQCVFSSTAWKVADASLKTAIASIQ